MDRKKITRFFRQNLIFYIIGFLILFGMKYYYSRTDCEGLRWILGPTAGWVELLSGIPFVYERGMGYANHSLRFLIAPSCSGVQFMIITAAMLIYSFVHEAADRDLTVFSRSSGFPAMGSSVQSAMALPADETEAEAGDTKSVSVTPQGRTGRGLCWIMTSFLLSYLLTVFVNGLRIIAAIYLPSFFEQAGIFSSFLTADRLHTMIGVVVYFAALLTIHQLTGLLFQYVNTGKDARDSRQKTASALRLGKCLAPSFWYFFIVLGIPFLNRAYRKSSGRFTDFAFLVTICCGAVLFLYGFASLICRKLKDRN